MCGLTLIFGHQWEWRLAPLACIAIMLAAVAGCNPAHYRTEADEEVYDIIDDKWKDDFGQKVNYTISGIPPSSEDIRITRSAAPGVLSLAEAVAMATAHNRNYQRQKEQLYLAALDLTLARHQFARQWFGTVDARYVDDPAGERTTARGELGFSRALADGAMVGTSVALDWVRFLTGDPDTSLRSVLSASITQPLLRGRGRDVAQEQLTQAERNALYQIRSFNRFRKTFVVSIANDYYGVLQLADLVTNTQNDYERRVQSRDRLTMEGEAGRRDAYEVDQAEQDVLRAQNNVVAAQQRYEAALDQLKIRLALPTDAEVELDPNELEALRRIGVSDPVYTAEDAIETALRGRLDLANSADAVEDAARKVIVAADDLGAELNLVGSAGVGSSDGTRFTRLDFDGGTYSLGLQGDLPLDRKAERNAYREALIVLEQQRRQHEIDADTVKLEVREAYRQLELQAESYRIQENSLRLAEKRVESTSMLLQAGRATTRDLLESQNALLEAQTELTAALVGHTIAKLAFFRDVGLLQVRPDGMWHDVELQPHTAAHASPDGPVRSQPSQHSGDGVNYRDFLGKPERFWESL